MLCLPLSRQSKRFIESVRLAPAIDQLLKQAPGYEFISHKQDNASILFYSQELKRVSAINDSALLEKALTSTAGRPYLCYLSEQDFLKLTPTARQNNRVILKYKDRIVITDRKDTGLVVILPPD